MATCDISLVSFICVYKLHYTKLLQTIEPLPFSLNFKLAT
eukprot:UN18847